MSHETTKAQKRRWAEPDFSWKEIFRGDILDVGSGDDPLKVDGAQVTPFNLPDGGGDNLITHFPSKRFNCIHGSQVLEHAINPAVMLSSWVACLKPNGYIVATVPDWKLYEKFTWPSKWNGGHRSTWSMDVTDIPITSTSYKPRIHIKLPEWLQAFSSMNLLLCRLVTTNFDFTAPPDVDQTWDASKNVECFIEFVLQRR